MRRRLFANRDLRIEFIETSVCSVLRASLTALHLIFIEHIHIYIYIYTHIYTLAFSIGKISNPFTARVPLSFQRGAGSWRGKGGREGKEEREDEFAPRITFLSRSAPSQLRPIGGELKLGCGKGWRLKLKLS